MGAAVRLRKDAPPPLPVGVHRCTSDENKALNNYKAAGEGAPVVLHYANCGFGAWKRKYQILAKGHRTDDGGFSITRKGINSMRAHLAHRELIGRGTIFSSTPTTGRSSCATSSGSWPTSLAMACS